MKIARVELASGICHVRRDGAQWRVMEGDLLDGTLKETGVIAGNILRFLSPLDPVNVICVGVNYRNHSAECAIAPPPHPAMFIKLTSAVIGHETPIRLPASHPAEVDYEAELAVVIGRSAFRVSPEKALNYVLGYTCANDVSARDVQLKLDLQWARGKSFDTFCPLGPVLETELDLAEVVVSSRLNGKTMQCQGLADLIFDVPHLISFLSQEITLLPGTVILTGTPGGVGMAQRPPRYLASGDVSEVEISGIGVLRNQVL